VIEGAAGDHSYTRRRRKLAALSVYFLRMSCFFLRPGIRAQPPRSVFFNERGFEDSAPPANAGGRESIG